MADWPDTAELAQVLDVDNIGDWTTTLDRVLAAAIRKVKSDVAPWDDDVDEPDENEAQAALRMAELISERPGARTEALDKDPAYRALLFGHRKTFGIA